MKSIINKYNRKTYKVFAKFVGRSSDELTRNLFRLFQFSLYSSILIILINSLFNRDEKGLFNWGQYGDFMGGVLSPILSFVAIMGILVTIVIQHNELKETRREFKRSADALDKQSKSSNIQNFESAFFNLLELHNEIVNRQVISSEDLSNNHQGNQCFNYYYFEFIKNALNIKEVISSLSNAALVEYSYKTFNKHSKKNLEQYFRSLYSILRFVEKNDDINKSYYYEVFKAQLSSYELAIIFYDGLAGVDRRSKSLIERSSLLENINTTMLVSPLQDIELYENNAFGSNSERISTIVNSWNSTELKLKYRDIDVYFSFSEMLKNINNVNPLRFVVLSQPELCQYIKWDFVPEEAQFIETTQNIIGANRAQKEKWLKEQLKFRDALSKGMYYFDFSDPNLATEITCYGSDYDHTRDEWFSETLPRLIGEINPSLEKSINGSNANAIIGAIQLGLDYESLLQEFDSYRQVVTYIDKKLRGMNSAFDYVDGELHFEKSKYKL